MPRGHRPVLAPPYTTQPLRTYHAETAGPSRNLPYLPEPKPPRADCRRAVELQRAAGHALACSGAALGLSSRSRLVADRTFASKGILRREQERLDRRVSEPHLRSGKSPPRSGNAPVRNVQHPPRRTPRPGHAAPRELRTGGKTDAKTTCRPRDGHGLRVLVQAAQRRPDCRTPGRCARRCTQSMRSHPGAIEASRRARRSRSLERAQTESGSGRSEPCAR